MNSENNMSTEIRKRYRAYFSLVNQLLDTVVQMKEDCSNFSLTRMEFTRYFVEYFKQFSVLKLMKRYRFEEYGRALNEPIFR